MKNISKRSKRNPWRNTRNDFSMPWQNIWATVLTMLLPFGIVFAASNIVLRSSAFYTFYVSRSGVVSELLYNIESSDLAGAFHKFMMHSSETFSLTENRDYKPQQVFGEKDAVLMGDLRNILDISLIAGLLILIICIGIGTWLYAKGSNKLLYRHYLTSWPTVIILLALISVLVFVIPLRNAIMFSIYGDDFPPADSLMQIFDAGFWMYFGICQLVVTLALMLIILYIMKKFVNAHKMFKL